MRDHTPDALASALPAGIMYDLGFESGISAWRTREIAKFQAEKLAESGYVLLHPEYVDEATVERLARAQVGYPLDWDDLGASTQDLICEGVRIVLAALVDTAAEAGDPA